LISSYGEFTWGNLTHSQEMRSLKLFGTEVMPALAKLGGKASAA
jgi:hypothetical protein